MKVITDFRIEGDRIIFDNFVYNFEKDVLIGEGATFFTKVQMLNFAKQILTRDIVRMQPSMLHYLLLVDDRDLATL